MDENRKGLDSTANLPCGGVERGKDLDAMSVDELTEEFGRVWGEMDEDTYDEELLNKYLDALDRKSPMPDMPSADQAYEQFLELLHSADPKSASKAGRTGRRVAVRAAVAAAIAVIAAFGAMITVQAAGVDVFGSIARWTEEVFSFGENTVKKTEDTPAGEGAIDAPVAVPDVEGFTDLQQAFDAYGITDVKAPTWLPEGYEMTELNVMDQREFDAFSLAISFTSTSENSPTIVLKISQSSGSSSGQIQKDDIIVDKFIENDITLYLVKNERNLTITWADGKYEYQIVGENEEQLHQVVKSMFE